MTSTEKDPFGGETAFPWCGMVACLFLALVRIFWTGYQFGVGNQSIQVPMLLRWADPGLFPKDLMLNATTADYPSLFFRALALALPLVPLPHLYFGLHLLSTFAFFVSLFWLARAVSGDEATAWIALGLLATGNHAALAGETLSSLGFTHTWAALPVALAALALAWRGRLLAAALLAGFLWNVHALTAAWLAAFLAAIALAETRRTGWRRLLTAAGAFLLSSAPTLLPMLARRQAFGPEWLELTCLRSSEHIFPSSWWQVGAPDLPRFVLLGGLGVLAAGLHGTETSRRKVAAVGLAALFLLLLGALGTEVFPLATLIRAQAFRSSGLLTVLLLVLVAGGIADAWRAPFAPAPRGAMAWVESASAAFVFLVLAVPAFLPLLPTSLLLAALVALARGRLSAPRATLAGAAMLFALVASREIHFPLAAGPATLLDGLRHLRPALPSLFWPAFAGAALMLLLDRLHVSTAARIAGAVAGILAALLLVVAAWPLATNLDPENPWVEAQIWAREHTPVDALLLTPIRPGSFRIHSHRSVVAEWRDGTQMFFNAGFAHAWWDRMRDLQPGIAGGPDRRLANPGTPLDQLDDRALVELAARHGATHLVLPSDPARGLVRVHANARWAIYLPKARPSPPAPAPPATPEAPMENPLSALEEMGPVDPEPPPEVYNREVWQAEQQFFSETILPNIEKHRKSDVTLHVVGLDGQPIRDLAVEVRQVKQAFGFGCSLGFFIVPSTPKAWGDFKPPAVTEAELEAFPKVFNHSLIPFSGKWMHLEGTEGVRWFEDLDRYVEWCASHGISMEYHFVSGYAPPWLKQKKPEEKAALFLNHARELAQRYGDRIRSWQVVNEKHLIEHSPAVFEELRRLMPKASLGISDCANFWSGESSPRREKFLHRGLDEVRWLKSKGIQVDFFGFHGHRPFGVWPDPREMYEILDAFQKEGVRIHVTEFSLPIPSPILGPSRRGTWTPALQAEFYRWFFTVLFSHPAVDSVNLWGIGPEVWQKGSGLLDEKYQPKPNFFALQDLTQREFLTRLDGRLSPEGTLAFRAFHGEYEILLMLPSGQKARAAFTVAPGAANTPRFRLDPTTANLSAP